MAGAADTDRPLNGAAGLNVNVFGAGPMLPQKGGFFRECI